LLPEVASLLESVAVDDPLDEERPEDGVVLSRGAAHIAPQALRGLVRFGGTVTLCARADGTLATEPASAQLRVRTDHRADAAIPFVAVVAPPALSIALPDATPATVDDTNSLVRADGEARLALQAALAIVVPSAGSARLLLVPPGDAVRRARRPGRHRRRGRARAANPYRADGVRTGGRARAPHRGKLRGRRGRAMATRADAARRRTPHSAEAAWARAYRRPGRFCDDDGRGRRPRMVRSRGLQRSTWLLARRRRAR